MKRDKEYLIVSASQSELMPTKALLSELPNFNFAIVGIGLVQASIKTCAAIKNLSKKKKIAPASIQLIFIGSVGSIDDTIPILSLVSANKSVLVEPASFEGKTFLVDKMNREQFSADCLFKNLASTEIVSTSLGITIDPELAKKISMETGATCENLELFGVASTAQEFAVAWSSLSCVTNHLNQQAHSDWLKNHEKAAEVTANALKTWASSPKKTA